MHSSPLLNSLELSLGGDRAAEDELDSLLRGELHVLAEQILRRRGPGLSLGATDLVHEACLRIMGDEKLPPRSRSHLLGLAGIAMRRIVASYARRKLSDKRGGEWKRVTLSDLGGNGESSGIDIIALDDVLDRLAALDGQQSRLVILRVFSGMSIPECAEVMGSSPRTLDRVWRGARAWLSQELGSA